MVVRLVQNRNRSLIWLDSLFLFLKLAHVRVLMGFHIVSRRADVLALWRVPLVELDRLLDLQQRPLHCEWHAIDAIVDFIVGQKKWMLIAHKLLHYLLI